MKKGKELLLIIFIVVVTNLFMCFLFIYSVMAEEQIIQTEKECNLPVSITYNGAALSPRDSSIYFTNHEVDINVSAEVTSEETTIINQELSRIKEAYSLDDVSYYADEVLSVIEYDGPNYLSTTEMAEPSMKLSILENDDCRKKIYKFEKTKAYKFVTGEGEDKTVRGVLNIKLVSPVYQFIFDVTAPQINLVSDTDFTKAIDASSMASFKLTDSSGIESIELFTNEAKTDEVIINGDKRITEYDYDVILNKCGNENDTVKLIVTDICKNQSEYSLTYTIDDVPPQIELMGVSDGDIAGGDTHIAIKARDNRDKVFVFYKCIYSDGSGASQVLECITDECNGEYIADKNYSAEGIYDIIAFAYDSNGNYSDTIRLSFGIDAKAPDVLIENVSEGAIYNKDVTLHATVRELFYDRVAAVIKGSVVNNVGEQILSLPPYDIKSKINKNIYAFNGEGKYSIDLSATDGIGHVGNTSVHFTVDKYGPDVDVEIAGFSSDELNHSKSKVLSERPVINIASKDSVTEYEVNTVLYRKEAKDGYKEEEASKVVSIGQACDFDMEVKREGEYLLKVSAKDQAGNITEKTMSFIVDENPPIIGYIENFAEKYLKYFTLPKNMADYIQDMTSVRYKAYLNSKEVSSCEIKKDGKYMLQIVAEDEAGNKSEESACFIVDNTLPKIIVDGIDGEGLVRKDGVIKLTLFDEDDYFKSARVNGENIKIKDGRKEIIVKADKYGDYDISVVAADYAGNETTQVIKTSCALSANPFTVSIKKSDVETLTKNEEEIRESFLDKITGVKFVIFCGFLFATAVIFLGIALFDTFKNKG